MSKTRKSFIAIVAEQNCRYLRDNVSKHHVDALHGQQTILQSCLSYMISARVFLDQDSSYSLLNEIARTSHGIHRYVWKYSTTHLNKYVQLVGKAGLRLDAGIVNQLRSLLWLHKAPSDSTPSTIDDLQPLLSAFSGMPGIQSLLSKLFVFQDSISSVEQKIDDPDSKLSYKITRFYYSLDHVVNIRVFCFAANNHLTLINVQCYELNWLGAIRPGLVKFTRDMRSTLRSY